MLKKHFVLHKKIPAPSIQKVTPERVAARRQSEIITIYEHLAQPWEEEENYSHYYWLVN